MTQLDEIIKKLAGVPEKDASAVVAAAMKATEHMGWIPNPGPQTNAYFSEADEVFYGGQAGGGKGLALDTPLVTPQGWTTMGAVAEGDILVDENGAPCEVLAVSSVSLRPCYELTFDDGSKLIADDVHRWVTYDDKERHRALCATDAWKAKRRSARPSRAKGLKSEAFVASIVARNKARSEAHVSALPTGTVRDTLTLASSLLRSDGGLNHAIKMPQPLKLQEAILPIPPYTLGAWLGDGTSASGGLTGEDPEIWQRIESEGYVVTHSATDAIAHYVRGLKTSLRGTGLLGNKHIPTEYLRASVGQRVALLQGLMDTDGHAALDGACEFDNTNKRLAEGVLELALSLGLKATLLQGTAKLNGRVISDKWRVRFTSTTQVFHLKRKAARIKTQTRSVTAFRYLVSCTPVPSVPTKCISVSSPTRQYLAGRSMIPTHNTDLELGLALTAHTRSLVLRRTNKEADGLVERMAEILGNRNGWNSQAGIWRLPNGVTVEIGGCQLEEDKQKRKGIPHDLLCFDEVSDFTESQYTFIIGWNRSADVKQRCRIVAAGNPPTRPEGLWVIHRWGAWLDPQHANPAQPGELRWYTNIKGKDTEVDGPGPHVVEGEDKPVYARSRTFIPAELSDNPDLSATNYGAVLSALPEELRAAYRDGRFDMALRDEAFQTIPTAWVKAAQARWKPTPPLGVPMCGIGVDVAQGGVDKTVLAPRYDGWYAPLVIVPGAETPDGASVAGLVVKHRRNDAEVVVDVGGGWGGDAYGFLCANRIPAFAYMGVKSSNQRTTDKQLKFTNVRTEAYWRFREALDPSQPQGSGIALPPDATLLSDLCAPTYEVGSNGIKLESKEKVCDRIGRSTDRGDAVVMAWYRGMKQQNVQDGWRGLNAHKPQVVMGHMAARR